MNNMRKYYDIVQKYLDLIEKTSGESVKKAAEMFIECFEQDGIVQLIGIKHGLELSMVLGYRAGGLMPFHRVGVAEVVMKGLISPEEAADPGFYDDPALARRLLDNYNIYPNDMFLISSSGGGEAVVVEAAMIGKQEGRKVIAVVNMNEVRQTKSTHPSGKNVVDIADLVIDTQAPYPDLNVELPDGQKMCQINTICGNIIAQMITAETYRMLTEQGKDCPILLSVNVKGADAHNRAISDRYEGRWNSV